MKSVDELIDHIIREISEVYRHPKMFAFDASGTMATLATYHGVWAEATGRQTEFEAVLRQVLEEERCGPYYFDRHYKLSHPTEDMASEDSAIAYVIAQFRRIDQLLNIALPQDTGAES